MVIKSVKTLTQSKAFPGYVITFGIEFLIMVITVALFKIVAIKYSDIGFAEFSINKRLVGFMLPLMMMGIGVSLPKLLPTLDEKQQLEIHYSALIIVASLFIITMLLFFIMSSNFSKWVFGDYYHKKMCLASLLYVISLIVHACVYNFFRGKFKFTLSSILQLINLGILPLLTWFFAANVLQYLIILSTSTIVLLIIVNIWFIPFIKISFDVHKSNIKKIIHYGVQRMPGDVVLGLFLAIPAMMATNYFSITIGGNIAFCLSLFNIVIALMSPVNIILLPKAARIIYDKNFTLFKDISTKLLVLSTSIGVISFVVVYFFGDKILELFNVKNHEEATMFLNIIFIGIIGYSIFSVIRSIIDAFYERARVTTIIIISFLVFIISAGVLKFLDHFTIRNILIAFTVSINVLGLLTYLTLTRIFKSIRI